jgi:hypothetical protein
VEGSAREIEKVIFISDVNCTSNDLPHFTGEVGTCKRATKMKNNRGSIGNFL